jgi:hypothetical protein
MTDMITMKVTGLERVSMPMLKLTGIRNRLKEKVWQAGHMGEEQCRTHSQVQNQHCPYQPFWRKIYIITYNIARKVKINLKVTQQAMSVQLALRTSSAIL